MRPIAADVAWSVCLRVCYVDDVSGCLFVATVSPTKTAEPIEVPFWLWTVVICLPLKVDASVLPVRRYACAAVAVVLYRSVCVCHKSEFCRKQLDELSCVLAWYYPLTISRLIYHETRKRSLKNLQGGPKNGATDL